MPERETGERIATEAATVAVIADECIAAKSSLETWRRRVVIALGIIGTRVNIFPFFSHNNCSSCVLTRRQLPFNSNN